MSEMKAFSLWNASFYPPDCLCCFPYFPLLNSWNAYLKFEETCWFSSSRGRVPYSPHPRAGGPAYAGCRAHVGGTRKMKKIGRVLYKDLLHYIHMSERKRTGISDAKGWHSGGWGLAFRMLKACIRDAESLLPSRWRLVFNMLKACLQSMQALHSKSRIFAFRTVKTEVWRTWFGWIRDYMGELSPKWTYFELNRR